MGLSENEAPIPIDSLAPVVAGPRHVVGVGPLPQNFLILEADGHRLVDPTLPNVGVYICIYI